MNLQEMVANNQEVLVQNVGGVLVADSLGVAERFGKSHNHVMRDIDKLINDLAVQNWTADNLATQNCVTKPEAYFIPSEYENRGKRYRKFLLTRDGFSLLVMGFTGTAALHWKLLYIEAFNKMEAALKKQNQTPLQLEQVTDLITQISTQVATTIATQITVTITTQLVEQLAPLLTGQQKAELSQLKIESAKKEVVVAEPKSIEARPCMRRIEFLKGNRDALPNLLTVYDVRDFLGVGQKFAYELIHKDGFPAKKIGTSYQIPKEDFLKWYDQQGKEGN